MLWWSLVITCLGKIRNELLRGTVHVRRLAEKRSERRPRSYGHEIRRGEDYIGRKMRNMPVPGRGKGGRPSRRYMHTIKWDVKVRKIEKR